MFATPPLGRWRQQISEVTGQPAEPTSQFQGGRDPVKRANWANWGLEGGSQVHVCLLLSCKDLSLFPAHTFGGSQLPVIQAPRDLMPSCGLHGTCTHVHTPTHRYTHMHLCTRTHTHTCTHPSVLPRGRLSSDIWYVWLYLLITHANLLRSGPNFLAPPSFMSLFRVVSLWGIYFDGFLEILPRALCS